MKKGKFKEPAVGQYWDDMDPRRATPRRVRILEIGEQTGWKFAKLRDTKTGKVVRASLDRIHPGNCGYSFVRAA